MISSPPQNGHLAQTMVFPSGVTRAYNVGLLTLPLPLSEKRSNASAKNPTPE